MDKATDATARDEIVIVKEVDCKIVKSTADAFWNQGRALEPSYIVKTTASRATSCCNFVDIVGNTFSSLKFNFWKTKNYLV